MTGNCVSMASHFLPGTASVVTTLMSMPDSMENSDQAGLGIVVPAQIASLGCRRGRCGHQQCHRRQSFFSQIEGG